MSAVLNHFSLNRQPFGKEIPDAELWLPPSKKRVVDELVEAVEERQSVLLTGDPGVGKTTVLRALRHRMGEGRFRLTYCHNATLGRRDFYRQLCLALGLAPSATPAPCSTPSARTSRSSAANICTRSSCSTRRT